MITHIYTVRVQIPDVYGDGWSRYPDYSAGEVGRMLRRAVHQQLEEAEATVEFVESVGERGKP